MSHHALSQSDADRLVLFLRDVTRTLGPAAAKQLQFRCLFAIQIRAGAQQLAAQEPEVQLFFRLREGNRNLETVGTVPGTLFGSWIKP